MADTSRKIAKADMDAAIAAAEAKYGDKLPKDALRKFAEVESKYGTLLFNPSGAVGPWQFMEPTGKQYGLMSEADRLDPYKSADAAARLLIDNKRDLEKRIGRTTTLGELYLAHQQGASGASKLLKDPNANAAAIVGAERVRQNLPESRRAEHTKLTTGEFAKLWTSKFDGGAATAPAKKLAEQADSALAAFVGQPQGREAFFNYDPNRLEQLKQRNQERGGIGALQARTPVSVPKEAVKPVNKIQGSLLAQTSEDVVAGEAKPVVPQDRRSTAILQGLSVHQKSMERLAPALLDIEAVEAPVTAPEGIAGTFSRGVDAGLANAAADREYFGAILDSITGQPDKAAGKIRDARLRETEAANHVAGMETFQEFLHEPTFGGFLGQVIRATGETAPSAIETVVSALATGGTYSFAKLGLSQGAKVVARTLVKDLVSKKAKGEALDAAEDSLLDAMFKDFKRGAVAGAFGQEYVPAAGGAFAEFGEAGQEMGSDQALMSLGIGLPQAAIGVAGEKFILKGLAKLALKKSTREAGDSVLKRFAADVSAAALKSGTMEGLTEVGQEGISVAQRMAIDPEFTMEDAQLRLAQAAFSGFFGGAALGGGGAVPASGVSIARSEKVAGVIDKAMKKAKDIIKDTSDARVEAEVDSESKGVDDESVMTGRTAPEPLRDFQGQVAEVLNPNSPKKAMWASEQQDIGLPGMIPGEVSSFEEDGKTLYVANLPGHGNLITTEQSIANELMATFNSGGDVKQAIGLALDYKGKPGDNVVQVKNADGAVVHEQSFDEPSRAAAVATAQQMAEAAKGKVEVKSATTALEERAQAAGRESVVSRQEQDALLAFDRFMQDAPEQELDAESQAEQEIAARETELGLPSYRFEDYLINDEIPVKDMSDDEMDLGLQESTIALKDEKAAIARGRGDADVVFKIENDIRAIEAERERRKLKAKKEELTIKKMTVDDDGEPTLLNTEKGGALLDEAVKAAETDTSYEGLKQLRNNLRKKAADSLKVPKPTPKNDLTPAEIHAAHDRHDAEVKRRVSIERAVSLLNDAIDAHEIMLEEGKPSADLQRVVERRAKSAAAELRSTIAKPDEELTVKKMTVDDDGEASVEDEATSEADVVALEDQLNQRYAELDAESATRIKQFNPRAPKLTPEEETAHQAKIDEAWLKLAQLVPDEAQFEQYNKFKDRMPLDMIKELIKLNESNDDDGALAYYDVAEDPAVGTREEAVLSITQRDVDPKSETVITRDTVKAFLRTVASWSKTARHNGAAQIGRDGQVESIGGSLFWLVNRRTGKAMRLNGTPPKKGDTGFGRQGVGVMATVGRRLNAQTDQALGGDGLTNVQQYAQGLLTMLKALAEAGYDLQIGTRENNLRPFTNPRKLPEQAAREVVLINKKGRAYTLPELMGVKAPFTPSKSDFDAGENIEQLANEKELVTPSVNIRSEGRVETRAPQEKTVDRNEERALSEARQKKQGGFDAEEQDFKDGSAQKRPSRKKGDPTPRHGGLTLTGKKVETARDAEITAARYERVVVDEAIQRDMPEIAEEQLRDIPEDITIKITNKKGMFQAELNSERFPRGGNIVESETLAGVVALAHAKANSKSQQRMFRYDRIGLEGATHNTEQARERISEDGKADPKIPEISGVPAAKDQTSLRDEKNVKVLSNANSVKMLGKFGPMTNRVMGLLLAKLTLQRPLTVMTLSHLKQNFDAMTADGGLYAGAKDALATTISDMEDNNEQGRVLMGNRYLIVVKDTPKLGLKPDGSPNIAPDDALIGSILAHEVGHILFKLEYERNIDQGPEKSILWNAYVKQAKAMEKLPSQYTNNKDGFEEWFADQVMAWVYKGAGYSAKNAVDSIFKRIADAFRAMYERVNAALGGRLKLNPTFSGYMKDVVQRHAVNRKLNNDIPVATSMTIKSLNLNLASRIPTGLANRLRNRAQNGTTMGKVIHTAQNLLQASVDFMAANEHGQGGKNLKKFFGTESQSQDKVGWNKRKLFVEARYANEFAKIFGFDEKTPGKEWRSQRVTDILNEAEDNDIDTVNLSTPEAKKVRELFDRLYDDYLIDPMTGKTWFGNIYKMPNYGGPRMFNADKINQNPEAFVQWLQAHPTWGSDPVTFSPTGRPVSRAHAVVAKIIGKIGEPISIIEAGIDEDVANNALLLPTPADRAAEIFYRSADDRAVMEAKNKILRDAEKGNAGYTMQELLAKTLVRHVNNSSPAAATLRAVTSTDPKEIKAALDKFWMESTRETRLTPGMDPALTRTLPKIKTSELRNATPDDPNGWLLPQAVAVQQYFHFATRKVEYAKMGGFNYVEAQLKSIPEEFRDDVDAAIMANLGKFGENMSNKWRLFNSAAAVATVFTTLLFTTLSSITDFAGIATRSKEFRNLGTYFNVLKKTMSDREYAELARSVGTVVGRAQDHAMIGLGELDYANRTSRAIMDGFFRYTGLEFFTRFSRTVATGMGKEFILNTANREDFGAREERYLAELGLTRADVRSWVADNYSFETPDGMLVRDAIARFSDESIIRPDASQRPTWASNPYFSTIWQLKSYYYGFGKTVMGGLIRETKNRYDESGGDLSQAAAIPALLAVTIFPLTMLGLGGREWAKYLFQLAIPGVDETPFRTSYMDMGEYSWEIFKRSGVMGPFALALTTLEAIPFEGIAAPFTANIPLVDMFDDSIFDGDGARLLPVVNNIK